MPSYPVSPLLASDAADGAGWPPDLPGGGLVAIRLADLACPVRRVLREGDRTALTTAGAGRIRSGDLVVFCKPVVIAPAVVRRDGHVQAGGHPADHARLGVLEQQLDEMTGQHDTIGQVAARVKLAGKVKGTARRCMTTALTLRAVLLMTLMPEADYTALMTALLGDLAGVPWHIPFAVPTATVLSTWRGAAGPAPVLRLQEMTLAAAGHEARDDYRAVPGLDLDLGAVDGTLTRTPDTKANRAAYGSAGTGDDSSPYPQLRDLLVSDAYTRATLAVLTGPSGGDKAEAEQKLLDRALAEYPRVFTKGRLWVLDRNFPGVARISRLVKVTHVLIRLKCDIPVRRIGPFLPDGSCLADVCGSGQSVRMRVIEYHVTVEGQDVPEMFCLVTDLEDWRAYPAAVLAGAYKWRWDGSETALREAKSAIRGAGPSTGPMFRSGSPDLIRQEHAAWVTAVELTRAIARAAAAAASPAGKGRRAAQPAHPREISFTAARRAAVASVRYGTATASLCAEPARATTLAGIARHRVTVDRDRHRARETKARGGFRHARRDITTRTATAQISVCGSLAA